MLNRRTFTLAAVGGLAFLAAGVAQAQDWKAKFPELVFATIPSENASGTTDRWTPLVNYLSRELGIKVTLRIANDYAAVVEGQRAGNIHLAQYGPSAYARAIITGAKVEPFAIETNVDGTKGYHSVLWVKAGGPYQKIEDLKGTNLCLVDPNSTSGNNVPRFALNKMGLTPETFFANVVYSGSHENAIIGLNQGTCDAAFNWWNDNQESNLLRMARKNMVKAEDFRIIFKSEQIVNSPMAYLADLPADLKEAVRTAILEMPKKDPAGFQKIYEGKQGPWQPVDHAAYAAVMELTQFVDSLRKQRS